MLPTVGREPKFIGRIGAELDVKMGHMAAYLAAVNALAVARSIWDRWTKLRESFG